MTELDDILVPEAKALIERFGRDTTFELEIDNNDYDPATSKPTVSKSSHVAKATPPFEYNTRQIDGDIIQVGDQYVMVAASGLPFTPEVGMVVLQGSQRWKAVRIVQHDSGEQTAAYEIHVRL